MFIFKNAIFVFLWIGAFTRLLKWYLGKKMQKLKAAYITFFLTSVILLPLAATGLGFDVAFIIYLGSLLIWLIFDLLRSGASIE